MSEVLNTLLDTFKKLKGEKGKKGIGWIFGIIAGAVAALIIGMLSFRAWKTGKKLAALQHEKDVAEELKEQAKAQEEIDKIDEQIKVIDTSLQEAKETYIKAVETIDQIKNWDDFDKMYGG